VLFRSRGGFITLESDEQDEAPEWRRRKKAYY
jgi:hypothetical protein